MTPLAKTLKEDPSCQLCTVLQKYYLQADATAIESNLRENELPQLFTLRQVNEKKKTVRNLNVHLFFPVGSDRFEQTMEEHLVHAVDTSAQLQIESETC